MENEETIVHKQINSLNQNNDCHKSSFQNLARENKEFIINAKRMINLEKERVEQSQAKISEIIEQLIQEYAIVYLLFVIFFQKYMYFCAYALRRSETVV